MFPHLTDVSCGLRRHKDSSVLTTEQVTERNSSKIGSMVAEDGRDSLSKAPTENVAKEELDDSTDDEDEGGVSLSLEQLEDYMISGSAGKED